MRRPAHIPCDLGIEATEANSSRRRRVEARAASPCHRRPSRRPCGRSFRHRRSNESGLLAIHEHHVQPHHRRREGQEGVGGLPDRVVRPARCAGVRPLPGGERRQRRQPRLRRGARRRGDPSAALRVPGVRRRVRLHLRQDPRPRHPALGRPESEADRARSTTTTAAVASTSRIRPATTWRSSRGRTGPAAEPSLEYRDTFTAQT